MLKNENEESQINQEYANFYYVFRHLSGKRYYYNIGTHESTWFVPKDAIILHPTTRKIYIPGEDDDDIPLINNKITKSKPSTPKTDNNSQNNQTITKNNSEIKKSKDIYIPIELQEELKKDNENLTIDALFDKIFQKKKKGSEQNSYTYQDTPIPNSLLDLSQSHDKKATKHAHLLNKSILKYTQVRDSKEVTGTIESIVELIQKSAMTENDGKNSPFIGWKLNFGENDDFSFNLVDEAYAELLKQTNQCPPEHLTKNLELVNAMIYCFIPSKPIRQTMLYHLAELSKTSEDDKAREYSTWCYIVFNDICNGSLPELNITKDKPFEFITTEYLQSIMNRINENHCAFDASLTEIMFHQFHFKPNIKFPYVMHQMCEILFSLGCEQTVGIFRVPGNLTKIEEFKKRINSGDLDFLKNERVEDVASLFKSWARQIPGGIINQKLTDALIALENQESAMTVIDQMDEISKTTLMYLVGFLKKLSLSGEVTKMNVDNLAMVFGPNVSYCSEDASPMVSGMITKRTQNLLAMLMNDWDVSAVYPYNE